MAEVARESVPGGGDVPLLRVGSAPSPHPAAGTGPLGGALELAHVPQSGERAGTSGNGPHTGLGTSLSLREEAHVWRGRGGRLWQKSHMERFQSQRKGRTGLCAERGRRRVSSLSPHWREVGTQQAGLVPTDSGRQGMARSQRAGKEGRVCVSTWPPRERTAPPRAGPPVLSLRGVALGSRGLRH